MTTEHDALRRIADRIQIEELVIRYARARDTTDPAEYREVFAADATIGSGSGRIMSHDLAGILAKVADDQVRFNPDYDPAATGAARSYAIMRHQPGNILIELHGDAAASDYYVTTIAMDPAARRPEILALGRVRDDLERRDGRWWIVRSTLFFDWENDALGRVLQVGPYTPAQYQR